MVEIDDFLSPERMLLGLRSGSKRQLFQDLATMAAAATGLDPATILGGLEPAREAGHHGDRRGHRHPACARAGTDELTGFFARLARPVDYDALDDAPVDLVFLLLAPEEASAVQLKALARIARLLRDPEVLRRPAHARPRPRRSTSCCDARCPGRRRERSGAAARASAAAPIRLPRLSGCWCGAASCSSAPPGGGKIALLARAAGRRRLSGGRRPGPARAARRRASRACGRRYGLDRAARQRHLPRRNKRRGPGEPVRRACRHGQGRSGCPRRRAIRLAGVDVPLLRLPAGGTVGGRRASCWRSPARPGD